MPHLGPNQWTEPMRLRPCKIHWDPANRWKFATIAEDGCKNFSVASQDQTSNISTKGKRLRPLQKISALSVAVASVHVIPSICQLKTLLPTMTFSRSIAHSGAAWELPNAAADRKQLSSTEMTIWEIFRKHAGAVFRILKYTMRRRTNSTSSALLPAVEICALIAVRMESLLALTGAV